MNINEGIKIKGHVKITSIDEATGEVEVIESDNLIVTAGYDLLASVLIGAASISYCGVGSGSTAAAADDTDLETAVGARKPITTATRAGAIALFSTFFSSAENNGTWNEAILATGISGENIISRAVFSTPYLKTNLKKCTLDWNYTLT